MRSQGMFKVLHTSYCTPGIPHLFSSRSISSKPKPGQSLHFPAAFHGLEHGDFVGVFDVAAYWNAHGDTGYAQSLTLQLLGEVGGGGFSFDGGIGSHDDFFDFAASDASDQISHAHLFWPHSMQQR